MKNVTNRMICFSLEITKTPIFNEIKMFIVVDNYPSYLLRELFIYIISLIKKSLHHNYEHLLYPKLNRFY
jgi:hypothetical protein